MDYNKILNLIYVLFVGLLIAIFVGVGINTFYEPPEQPEYPYDYGYQEETSEEQIKLEKQYEKENDKYEKEAKEYYGNASVLAVSSSVVLIAFSIAYAKKIKTIGDGVMLGGLFTLLYSIGLGIASTNSKLNFGIVSVSLVVVIYLGYHRFIKTEKPVSRKTKK